MMNLLKRPFFKKKPPVCDRDVEWGIRVQRDEADMDRLLHSSLNANSNCVDVGAHHGVFLKRFMELSPEGRHFAFEPLPALASVLKRDFPKVDLYFCALGNRSGRVRFCHALELPGWSGLKRQPYPVETEVKEIEVELKLLDNVLPDEVPIHFIKIDVEGAELEVLEGAVRTIRRYRPCILFEHAKIHNLEYRTTPKKIYDFLTGKCGLGIYSLNGYGPMTRSELINIYYASYDSDYDRNAQTNFIARP
jgi:FkbM family methyltransferase